MHHRQPKLTTLILLTGFAAASAVLLSPALPEISLYFGYGTGAAQATISLFLLGYTIGQWLYAPITQAYGRKNTLYVGICISLIGTALCLLSSPLISGNLFLFGRFIQALGSSAGLIVTLAIIHDVYEGNEARRITAWVMLAFALLPGVAVLIGGAIIQYFPWQADFFALMFYSMLLFGLAYQLPETAKHYSKPAFTKYNLFNRYKSVMKQRAIVGYGVMWGACTAVIYIFSAILPLIAINEIGASPIAFSYAFLSTTIGLISGNFCAAHFAHRYHGRQVIKLGILMIGISLCAIWLVHFNDYTLSLFTLFACLFPTYFGMPLIFSNVSPLAAALTQDKTTASSLVTLSSLSVAVTSSTLIEFIHVKLSHLLPFTLLTMFLMLSWLYYFTHPKTSQTPLDS